ncbi:MAG: hypothetical protein V4472_25055 [Pseudomonadota bacterium]
MTYDGKTYTCRTYQPPPDLEAMTRIGALSWLCANTTPRGYSRATNPLAGLGGALNVTVK